MPEIPLAQVLNGLRKRDFEITVFEVYEKWVSLFLGESVGRRWLGDGAAELGAVCDASRHDCTGRRKAQRATAAPAI